MVNWFDKYERKGAYHWEWYANNQDGYADLVNFGIKHFPDDGRILDVGCGDGLTSYKLFEKGLSVVGVELNRVGIRYARRICAEHVFGPALGEHLWKRVRAAFGFSHSKAARRFAGGELRFVRASVYNLQYADAFDFVLCHDVFEHVDHPQLLLERIHAAMRQFAVISTPNGTGKKARWYDAAVYTPEQFKELLAPYPYEFLRLDDDKMYVKVGKQTAPSS